MIKKIVLTLLALIILAVFGVIALIVFVDPNNFREFISNRVKDKTGYELTIDGDLRWHIWPKISILTNAVRLEGKNANVPILTADNMRLDLELLPLFSQKLIVDNVFVKSAIINISDESKNEVSSQKPVTVNQHQSLSQKPEKNDTSTDWVFSLNKLEIVDSTVIYQQNHQIMNFRDIDILVTQDSDKKIALAFSGNINRDQQDFIYNLEADIDLSHFPQTAKIDLHNFTYDYQGVGVPKNGITGEISATFNYQQSPLSLSSQNFALTLNDDQISGALTLELEQKPRFIADLSSKRFNLTPFLPSSIDENNSTHQPQPNKPVISSAISEGNELAFLQNFDATLNVKVDEITINQLLINDFLLEAKNENGIATLNKVNLAVANGEIIAKGIANGKHSTPEVKVTTTASNIDLELLFQQIDLISNFKGQLNAKGELATHSLSSSRIMEALTGDLFVSVTGARLENLNIQQIIQSTVSQYLKEPIETKEYQQYTELQEMSANAKLVNGDINLSSIKATSSTIELSGKGKVSLINQDMDINLFVKILGGWNEKSRTIQQLQKVSIPLRIYGKPTALHYSIDIDTIIKHLLNTKTKVELDKLKNRLDSILNKKND